MTVENRIWNPNRLIGFTSFLYWTNSVEGLTFFVNKWQQISYARICRSEMSF